MMETFAVVLFFSFTGFFAFLMLSLFCVLLEMIFEDYVFGDICHELTKYCLIAVVVCGIIAIVSGFGTMFTYIFSQSMEVMK